MKRYFIAAALPLLGLVGCVSPQDATAEERASCERMEQNMGLGTTHDHAQMKGQGVNPMNLSHERCQQILRRS